jgi:hypothetical protein
LEDSDQNSMAAEAGRRRSGAYALLFLAARAPASAQAPRWNVSHQMRFYMYDSRALDQGWVLGCPGVSAVFETAQGEAMQDVHIYRALVEHPQRTRDPRDADAFYVPLLEYASWRAQSCEDTTHAARMLAAYSELSKSRWFDRYHGRDHFWVSGKSQLQRVDRRGTELENATIAPGDRRILLEYRLGRPFKRMLFRTIGGRDKSYGRAHPASRESSVAGCVFDVGFQPNQEALRRFDAQLAAGAGYHRPARRRYLMSFMGSLDVCCTGRRVRCALVPLVAATAAREDVLVLPAVRGSRGKRGWARATSGSAPPKSHKCNAAALLAIAGARRLSAEQAVDWVVRAQRGPSDDSYVQMGVTMSESDFCLVPAGDTCVSSRLYSAIAAGCVPVVLCDKFRGGLNSAFDWPASGLYLHLTAKEVVREPLRLLHKLTAVSAAELAALRARLVASRRQLLLQVGGGGDAISNFLKEVVNCFRVHRRELWTDGMGPKDYIGTYSGARVP